MKLDMPFWRLGEWLEKIGKCLFVTLVIFAALASFSFFTDSQVWLNNGFWPSLLFLISIIIARITLLKYPKQHVTKTDGAQSLTLPANAPVDEIKRQKLLLGFCGGLTAVCSSGLLMRILTTSVHDVAFWFLPVCGALGGLGFVLFVRSNWKYRGLISCMFGLVAILVALLMAYTAPIGIQHVQNLEMDKAVISEVHFSDMYSLPEFGLIQLSSLNVLFFSTVGIIVCYLESQLLRARKN